MSLNKLHPRLQAYVKENWKGLTEIQQEAFDHIYNGESCTIEAPTSGGKTEAVLFPLLTRIAPNKNTGFKILYIAPLKALLNDLALRVLPYAKMCYMEAFKWHGDVNQDDKVRQMIFPSDILLTTPESIEAILLRKGNWVEAFSSLETVVIDEAHYFALSERGSHLVSLLDRIDAEIGRLPQRIAVTATVGNADDLLNWIIGNKRVGVNIQSTNNNLKKRDFLIQYFDNNGLGIHSEIFELLKKKKSIVFERSRSKTEETATNINERNKITNLPLPIKVKTHHSSVSKRLREDAEYSIKGNTESSIDAIISTSTLELGIDIGDLDQVIQIGGLNSSGSFLQRVGRTGRREGRPQFFRGLCEDEDELVLLVGCVSLGIKRTSEKILFPKQAYHILAHQIICLCLQKLGTTPDQIWQTLSNTSCFSRIGRQEFDTLIEYMVGVGFLRSTGRNVLVTGSKTEEEFLRSNWKRLFAIFDTGPMYNVVDGKKVIGTLDSSFARAQKLPFVFVLGGQEWNAIKLDHELQQVKVEKNLTGIAPKWKALATHDIPFELAQEVGTILLNNYELEFLNFSAKKVIERKRNNYAALKWDEGKWILESNEISITYLWTFSGEKINRVIVTLFFEAFDDCPEYDFQFVCFKQSKKNALVHDQILNWLSSLKGKTAHELEEALIKKIDRKWFSKFSDCLPESLAKKTILEKDYDLEGFIREIKSVTIE